MKELKKIKECFGEMFMDCDEAISKVFANLYKKNKVDIISELDEGEENKNLTVQSIKDFNGDIMGYQFILMMGDASVISIKVANNYFKVTRDSANDFNFRISEAYTVRVIDNQIINVRELRSGSDILQLTFADSDICIYPTDDGIITNISPVSSLRRSYELWFVRTAFDAGNAYRHNDSDPMDFLNDFYRKHSNMGKVCKDKPIVRGKYYSTR